MGAGWIKRAMHEQDEAVPTSTVPVAAWLTSEFVRAIRWNVVALSPGKLCHGETGGHPIYLTALCLDRMKHRKILLALGHLIVMVDAHLAQTDGKYFLLQSSEA
jgi:hypothetical protein